MRRLPQLLPFAGALLYPFCLHGAVAFVGLAVPAFAVAALLTSRNQDRVVRRALHLCAAVPPLYVLALQLSMLGGGGLNVGWCACWLAIAAISWRSHRIDPAAASPAPVLRVTHGVAASLLLLGFLVAHLANHFAALWSVEAHRAVMHAMRTWYRATPVEPVVLGMCALLVISGVALIWVHTRAASDRYRTFQTAAGAYLAAFIVAHVAAILWGRSVGIDTDWYFAGGGPDGPPPYLIPYYPLAVFAVVAHCALGLRVVLRGHGIDPGRVVLTLSAIGALAGGLIVAALLGLRIRG